MGLLSNLIGGTGGDLGDLVGKRKTSAQPMNIGGYKGLLDMINGGGPGASGAEFSGGGLSDIANKLGIQPRQSAPPAAPMSAMAPRPVPQPAMAPAQRPQVAPPSAALRMPIDPRVPTDPQAMNPPSNGITFEQFLQMLGPSAQGMDITTQLQKYGEYLYGGRG